MWDEVGSQRDGRGQSDSPSSHKCFTVPRLQQVPRLPPPPQYPATQPLWTPVHGEQVTPQSRPFSVHIDKIWQVQWSWRCETSSSRRSLTWNGFSDICSSISQALPLLASIVLISSLGSQQMFPRAKFDNDVRPCRIWARKVAVKHFFMFLSLRWNGRWQNLRFVIDFSIVLHQSMQGGRGGIFKKQFTTRVSPASQWSIKDKLRLCAAAVKANYTSSNWLVYLNALQKASTVYTVPD